MTPSDQDPADPAERDHDDATEPADDGFWSGDDTSQTTAQHAETKRTSDADQPAGDGTTPDDR